MIKANEFTEKELLEATRKAASTLVDYRHIFLDNGENELPPAPFHYRWSEILLNGNENFAIEAFRECAKSTYVLRTFPLYSLTFPDESRDYIVIIKANADLASAKLKEISREYQSNPIISSNMIEIIEDSAKAFMVRVLGPDGKEHKVRIEAYGKGSSIRGILYEYKRPRIVIMDDIQDVDDARSPKTMEDDHDQFLTDIKMLGKATRIFMIANNLSDRCLIERIMKSPSLYNFKTERISSIIETPEGQVATWPEQFSVDFLLDEYRQYRELGKQTLWMRERMCISISPDSMLAQRSDISYYLPSDIQSIREQSNIYIRMDPAFSEKASADFTAIFIFALDAKGHWYVLEILYGHFSTEQKITKLFESVVKWQPSNVGIEDVGGQTMLIDYVIKEMTIRNIFFKLLRLKPGGRSKAERISLLQPLFKSNRFHLPTEAPWLYEFENELFMTDVEGNCRATNDDLLDACAYGLHETTLPYKQGNIHMMRGGSLVRQLSTGE